MGSVAIDLNQRPLDEIEKRIVRVGEVRGVAHRLSCLRREVSDEGSQAPEHALLLGGQELVAPLDRGEQRLVTGQSGSRTAREQPEAFVEPCGDPLDGQRAEACGGELQGKGYPIERSADADDRRKCPVVDCQVGVGQAGSVYEQPNGFGVLYDLLRDADGGTVSGQGERRNLQRHLAGYPEWFAAGHQ